MTTIQPADIREGDVVTATKNGITLTAPVTPRNGELGAGLLLAVFGPSTYYDISLTVDDLAKKGFTFELIERPRAPFVPGIYRDADGDLRARTEDGRWYLVTLSDRVRAVDLNDPWTDSDEVLGTIADTLTFVAPLFVRP